MYLNSPHLPLAITISCSRCGSGAFNTPGDRDDLFIVTCKSCEAAIGVAKEIEGAAQKAFTSLNEESSNDEVKDALRKAFKDFKTIRIE